MTEVTQAEADQKAMQIATDRATRRNELAEVKFGHQGGQLFVPTDGRMLMDMANMMSQAGLMVKDIYRGNAGACMGLIAVCAPYGMNPLQVSWKTYQTKPDAPIAYEAQVIVAMINSSGVLKGSLDYEFDGEGQKRRCRAFGTLRTGEEKEVWSPPLDQIQPKNSPLWKTDPDQQLCYYTGRAWARRHRPEMLLGIHSVDEELPAIGPENAKDVTPSRRGGVRYRDIDETPAPAAAERETAEPEDAEVVNGNGHAEDPALAELKASAKAAADKGMAAFRAWWVESISVDQRAMLTVDKAFMAKLQARCEEIDAAAKAKAAEPPSDPFSPAPSVPSIDFAKIASLIAKEAADVEQGHGAKVEEAYGEELAALKDARPDLYEPLAAAIDDKKAAPFPGDTVSE